MFQSIIVMQVLHIFYQFSWYVICKCKQIQQHYKQKNIGGGRFLAHPVDCMYMVTVSYNTATLRVGDTELDDYQTI